MTFKLNGIRACAAIGFMIALVFLAMTLPAQSSAFASVTNAKSASGVTAQSKSESKSQIKADKIAMAGAKISYSRMTYKKDGVGTKAYFKACLKLGKYYVTNQKQMQCNVPVAAAVRISGVDKKFPTTIAQMYDYMMASKKWKRVGNFNGETSSLKPGDVLIRVNGVTTYRQNGVKRVSTTRHVCLYVGSKIANSAYKKYLKGTDADRGKPGSSRVFVNARTALNQPSLRRAACLESRKEACADSRLIVFRFVG